MPDDITALVQQEVQERAECHVFGKDSVIKECCSEYICRAKNKSGLIGNRLFYDHIRYGPFGKQSLQP